jgi:hypothetical protein
MTVHKIDGTHKSAHVAAWPGLRWPAALLALILLSLLPAPSFAAHPYQRWADELGIDENVSYDGTRLMEFQGHQMEMTERRAPQKLYTEMYVADMTVGIIVREDLKKSYTLMPSMGFYREVSMEEGMAQAANGMEFIEIEKLGSDDVNGHASTRYAVSFRDNEGSGDGFLWVTDTGVPIKMDMTYANKDAQGQRMVMQFTELNLREQDPKYFEVPADLKPMGLGAGLSSLGAMMGMGGDAAADPAASAAEENLAAARKRCLEEAALAAEQAEPEESGGMFGSIMGAVNELGAMASDFGLIGGVDPVTIVYSPGASAADIAAAAEKMGVTPEDIERCRQP